MNKFFDGLHKKSELSFALVWIAIYCVANSLANSLSAEVGIDSSVNCAVNIILTVILYLWLKKAGLMKEYGLCRSEVPASRFLWYIPLLIVISHNLWLGAVMNLPVTDTVCYIASMLCVGFLEEVIFRGFLFKALAKDGIRMAIIISSVTFGLGHLVNLINGSGMELMANICQVVSAIVIGFLFVIIFYRGGSLIPCIITHSLYNALSVFVNEAGVNAEQWLMLSAVNLVIVAAYALILLKTLPKAKS